MSDLLGEYEGRKIYLDSSICSLPRNILWPLCVHLSGEQAVFIEGLGGNWRSLGNHIHLPEVMEEQIEYHSRARKTTPAFQFLHLWDEGILKNPGSIRKLIIAMYQCGLNAYLWQHIIAPLQAAERVNDMLASLPPDARESYFPVLELNDISWDMELDKKCSDSDDEEEKVPDYKAITKRHGTSVVPDSVYVSHIIDSSSKKYRTQVKNLVKALERRGHTVWYDSKGIKESNPYAWKERCIQSAATIIVVYNKEYQRAQEAFLSGRRLPSCLEVDIPCIHTLSYSSSRVIIPVVIDICRNIPDIPLWLGKMPKVLYPSQEESLIHCVQRVPRISVPRPTTIHRVQPQMLDVESIRRQHLQAAH